MVRARWEKSNSDVKLGIWNMRWHVMSLTPTPRSTTCCWDGLGFVASSSSHPLFIKWWNHWWRKKSKNVDCWKVSVQGVENYFTNSLLYQDSLEVDENSHPEEPDSSNEANTEPKEEECLWKINPLIMSIDKPDFNTTAKIKSEWFINENLDMAYFSSFASDLYRQRLILT